MHADREARIREKAGGKPCPNLEQKKIEAMLAAMAEYSASANWQSGRPTEHLSPETAYRIARILRLLLNGESVPGFEAVRANGRRRRLVTQEALEDAATYVLISELLPAVLRKHKLSETLSDLDPVETIRAAFGMNSRNQVTTTLKKLHCSAADRSLEASKWNDAADANEVLAMLDLLKVRLAQAAKNWRATKTSKATDRHVTDSRA